MNFTFKSGKLVIGEPRKKFRREKKNGGLEGRCSLFYRSDAPTT